MSDQEMIEKPETLNSIGDIRKFLEDGARPYGQGEFIEFWKSLGNWEKQEFLNTPLK